jgi:exo-poly-alpha-galacturonosidase
MKCLRQVALASCWLLVGLFTFTSGMTAQAAPPARRFVLTVYGAKGDNQTVNTVAVQAAIDAASAAPGGGTVVVPAGVFRTGAVFLKPGVSLFVEKYGVLKGTANPADYPQVATRWEGVERSWTAALLNAENLHDIRISGPGTIDGAGDEWVRQAQELRQRNPTPLAGPHYGRPRLICLQNCQRVRLTGLRLHNQAVWCLHILYCKGVTVKGLAITADHNIPSSDGIDVDSSERVRIADCSIDVNDDCISIKSGKDDDGRRVNRPSADILIENCRFGYGHGGVAMGSEVSGGIRRVLVRRCSAAAGNWAPIRFKSQPSRGGVVEDITFRRIQLDSARKAVEFNLAWRMVPPLAPPAPVLTQVRRVRIVGVVGTAVAVGDLHGLPNSPIQGVQFRRCIIRARHGLLLENVHGIRLRGLRAQVQQGPAVVRGANVQD